MTTGIMNLHPTHYISIDETTRNKSYKRCNCYTRCQTKDGMKSCIIGPKRSTRNPITYSSQRNKEEVHGKTGPYQQTGFPKSPNLAYAIIDDITYRKDNKATCQHNRAYYNLLRFQHICRNQANTKDYTEKHKQYTHLFFIFFHFLVLLKGVEQVPLSFTYALAIR